MTRLFERVRAVEWDVTKAEVNLRKHGIDFDEALGALYHAICYVARIVTTRSVG
jgi:uncharacterized DUF497 family protein